MTDNTKKAIAGVLMAVLLALALVIIIKMPTKEPQFKPVKEFDFTNAVSSNSKNKSNSTKNTMGNKTDGTLKNTNSSNSLNQAQTTTPTSVTEKTNSVVTAGPGLVVKNTQPNVNVNTKPFLVKVKNTPVGRFVTALNGSLNKLLMEIRDLGKEKKVEEQQVFVTEEIEYKVVYNTNHNLDPGETRIVTHGENGSIVYLYNIKYENGVEVDRQVISSQVTKEPVDEVIEIGPEREDTTYETTTTTEEPTTTTEEPTTTTEEPTTTTEDTTPTTVLIQ